MLTTTSSWHPYQWRLKHNSKIAKVLTGNFSTHGGPGLLDPDLIILSWTHVLGHQATPLTSLPSWEWCRTWGLLVVQLITTNSKPFCSNVIIALSIVLLGRHQWFFKLSGQVWGTSSVTESQHRRWVLLREIPIASLSNYVLYIWMYVWNTSSWWLLKLFRVPFTWTQVACQCLSKPGVCPIGEAVNGAGPRILLSLKWIICTILSGPICPQAGRSTAERCPQATGPSQRDSFAGKKVIPPMPHRLMLHGCLSSSKPSQNVSLSPQTCSYVTESKFIFATTSIAGRFRLTCMTTALESTRLLAWPLKAWLERTKSLPCPITLCTHVQSMLDPSSSPHPKTGLSWKYNVPVSLYSVSSNTCRGSIKKTKSASNQITSANPEANIAKGLTWNPFKGSEKTLARLKVWTFSIFSRRSRLFWSRSSSSV